MRYDANKMWAKMEREVQAIIDQLCCNHDGSPLRLEPEEIEILDGEGDCVLHPWRLVERGLLRLYRPPSVDAGVVYVPMAFPPRLRDERLMPPCQLRTKVRGERDGEYLEVLHRYSDEDLMTLLPSFWWVRADEALVSTNHYRVLLDRLAARIREFGAHQVFDSVADLALGRPAR